MGWSVTGQFYKIAEGRLGSMGQAVNQTLLGHSTPWIWSVVEFNSSGVPNYQNHSIFPSFRFYSNGNVIPNADYSPNAAAAAAFIGSNASYQINPPPNP